MAFILGNLTTFFQETRLHCEKLDFLPEILRLLFNYLEADVKGQDTIKARQTESKNKKYEEFNIG